MKGSQRLSCGGKFFSLLGLAAGLIVQNGQSQIVTLSNKNSTAQIDLTPGSANPGMTRWDIQGQNQLHQQWFYFRVGNTPEASIDHVGTLSYDIFQNRFLTSLYSNPNYNVQIDYTLTGSSAVSVGQTGHSDIGETITINNTSANPLDF